MISYSVQHIGSRSYAVHSTGGGSIRSTSWKNRTGTRGIVESAAVSPKHYGIAKREHDRLIAMAEGKELDRSVVDLDSPLGR